ncbi:hypothetical protein NIES1031_01990 [Chroogloeocystis siderophila 5.2 s.c.1]|uniref:Uncharacterized protein n=1 Tax=Chroogloeocystis siderophila 5.2 s.c.1 TaxID=247279 RepID=A0A1U7HYL9_9CHRO|nr:hypothetical protein NIES1031_01990 [Chroogloeocystis siderophila 5.2 s.c.1]
MNLLVILLSLRFICIGQQRSRGARVQGRVENYEIQLVRAQDFFPYKSEKGNLKATIKDFLKSSVLFS